MGEYIVTVCLIGAGALTVLIVIARLLSHSRHPGHAAGSPPPHTEAAVIERETKVQEAADTVRQVLMNLTQLIEGMNRSAESSSKTLSGIRETVKNIEADPSLAQAQMALLKAVDSVLQDNAKLRNELLESKQVLQKQQTQIESLETTVRIDALTGIGNRAAFDERLTEAVQHFHRYQEAFSLLLIDIDHFKRINDTHGHVAGDRVLKGVALKLKASLRGTDFIARYGGEEFGAILPRTPLNDAERVADEIREAISQSKFTMGDTALKLTISGGISEMHPDLDAEGLFRESDAALYAAKNAGRNQVQSHVREATSPAQ